jgi:hypothetical protein
MTYITVVTPPFTAVERFDETVGRLDGPPDGLEARYVGEADDGRLRVITLWESKSHADRFFSETLGPLLARTLGPEPQGEVHRVGMDVVRDYVHAAAR